MCKPGCEKIVNYFSMVKFCYQKIKMELIFNCFTSHNINECCLLSRLHDPSVQHLEYV